MCTVALQGLEELACSIRAAFVRHRAAFGYRSGAPMSSQGILLGSGTARRQLLARLQPLLEVDPDLAFAIQGW